MTVSFTVESPDLAKGLSNALAFIPASSRLKFVYLALNGPDELLVVGTDLYAAGMETVQIRDYQGPPQGAQGLDFLIDKGKDDTGATGLERAARTAGKVTASVTFRLSGIEFDPMGGDALETPLVQRPQDIPTYRALLGLFEAAEKRTAVIPGVVCLNPDLLSRFSKVKTDKAFGRMADCLFGEDELDHVLVKIGPNFKGLLMPVDREVNGANIGQDGLW